MMATFTEDALSVSTSVSYSFHPHRTTTPFERGCVVHLLVHLGFLPFLILLQDDGTVYEGCIVDGKAEGHGTETYPDGAAYEGEFREGLRDGIGAYYFANGKVYEGGWLDSSRHGTGIERQVDSDRRMVMKLVRYKHGSLQSSTVMLPGAEWGVSDEVRPNPKP